jgi:hypothetical protein
MVLCRFGRGGTAPTATQTAIPRRPPCDSARVPFPRRNRLVPRSRRLSCEALCDHHDQHGTSRHGDPWRRAADASAADGAPERKARPDARGGRDTAGELRLPLALTGDDEPDRGSDAHRREGLRAPRSHGGLGGGAHDRRHAAERAPPRHAALVNRRILRCRAHLRRHPSRKNSPLTETSRLTVASSHETALLCPSPCAADAAITWSRTA